MMLDTSACPEQAARLHTAIEATTAAGILTRDLGAPPPTEDDGGYLGQWPCCLRGWQPQRHR